MVALQIRGVTDDVRDTLTARARDKGQSLQAYLLALVESEARSADNLAILERFEGRTDGAKAPAGAAAREVRAMRSARETALSSGVDVAHS